MQARFYDAKIGRFLQEDTYPGTLDNPLSQNRYAYVMNDPMNYWDPTGRIPEWVQKRNDHDKFSDNDSIGEFWVYDGEVREYTSGSRVTGSETHERYIDVEYERDVQDTLTYNYSKYTVVNDTPNHLLEEDIIKFTLDGTVTWTDTITAEEIAEQNASYLNRNFAMPGDIDHFVTTPLWAEASYDTLHDTGHMSTDGMVRQIHEQSIDARNQSGLQQQFNISSYLMSSKNDYLYNDLLAPLIGDYQNHANRLNRLQSCNTDAECRQAQLSIEFLLNELEGIENQAEEVIKSHYDEFIEQSIHEDTLNRVYFINGIGNRSGPDESPRYARDFRNALEDLDLEVVLIPIYEENKFRGVTNVLSEEYVAYSSIMIEYDLNANPLPEGGSISIIGYSGGGPVAIGVANNFRNSNINIDTIGFIGTGRVINKVNPLSVNYGLNNVNQVLNVYSYGDLLSSRINSNPLNPFTPPVRNRMTYTDHYNYFDEPYIDPIAEFFSENISN
ncbi:RHS repeat-associated core domain-containing protein [Alkalibacillus haloalkaliphilus]|uniref:RHS repeat-associated core domain-containing protein n=1 Tax=Alkalibacillus haloalkaliphilus TaxID=94136 RepID=A0A511W5N7_9BACI|nr:hypothetical protein AHA02nite_20530 [Alkalibacillus haloalkaliphilus]